MESIKLEKGVIAVGGIGHVGKSMFCLQFANYLAKSEKVLFISYEEYSEKLLKNLMERDKYISKNLEVCSRYNFFGFDALLEIIEHVTTNNIKTVFFDNSDITTDFNHLAPLPGYANAQEFVEILEMLCKYFIDRAIFTTKIRGKSDFLHQTPSLRDFNFSYSIPNKCNQVFAIDREKYRYLDWNEDQTVMDAIELVDLKNDSNTTRTYKIHVPRV
jgi:hypothetical protein